MRGNISVRNFMHSYLICVAADQTFWYVSKLIQNDISCSKGTMTFLPTKMYIRTYLSILLRLLRLTLMKRVGYLSCACRQESRTADHDMLPTSQVQWTE